MMLLMHASKESLCQAVSQLKFIQVACTAGIPLLARIMGVAFMSMLALACSHWCCVLKVATF